MKTISLIWKWIKFSLTHEPCGRKLDVCNKKKM